MGGPVADDMGQVAVPRYRAGLRRPRRMPEPKAADHGPVTRVGEVRFNRAMTVPDRIPAARSPVMIALDDWIDTVRTGARPGAVSRPPAGPTGLRTHRASGGADPPCRGGFPPGMPLGGIADRQFSFWRPGSRSAPALRPTSSSVSRGRDPPARASPSRGRRTPSLERGGRRRAAAQPVLFPKTRIAARAGARIGAARPR